MRDEITFILSNVNCMRAALQPFRPNASWSVCPLVVSNKCMGPIETLRNEYGFEENSMQYNFFSDSPTSDRRFVYVMYSKSRPPPRTMRSNGVVARVFGDVSPKGDVVIWHVSVNKRHPWNNNKRGERWGVFGIYLDESTKKARWVDERGRMVTRTNADTWVRGTPNPYAVLLLKCALVSLEARAARQHDTMPCAHLFDKQYSHKSHPAILLIFRALGFLRTKNADAYILPEDAVCSLKSATARMLLKMAKGVPVI